MQVPSGVFAVPVVLAAAVLLWAGLEKVRDRAPLATTLSGLGISPRLAYGVPVVELGAVLALVGGAPPYLSGGLLALLGVSFAAAAAGSMLTGRGVACSCFGAGAADRRLGRPQLFALPLWLLAGWATFRLPDSTVEQRMAVFACVTFALAAVRAVPAVRGSVEARNTRRVLAGG
jgi:hypothetical protein